MSFLRFVGEDTASFNEPQGRVYSRIDRIEESASGEGPIVLFDCVDAEWFDELGEDSRPLTDWELEADWHISVVESPHGDELRRWGMELFEGEWVELRFEDSGDLAFQYLNLFAPPFERRVGNVRVLPGDEVEVLETKTSMDGLSDATEGQISEVLGQVPPATAAAVYDVGQGNCCAVLSGGVPSVYIDFGGGVLRDTKTFPAALESFCLTARPPVILTHWDWDHWSSARRHPESIESTWIVPRQRPLGAVHSAFLAELIRMDNVLVWPEQLGSVSSGELWIERCTGPPSNRNGSGLAVGLEVKRESRLRFLFPGDAAYHLVPSAGQDPRPDWTTVVVPHHGGRTRSQLIPESDGVRAGRLVYSYGRGNAYGHPFPDVRVDHAADWASTRNTADRDDSGLGHIQLHFDESDKQLDLPCHGSRCDLDCRQR